MELKTPTKTAKKAIEPLILDDKEKSLSPKSVTEDEEEEVEDYRRRFVGDVDLPESMWLLFSDTSVTRLVTDFFLS